MHQTSIDPDIRERVVARCGKPHPFDLLMPEKTALVVIDMQNYFVEPPYLGWVPMAKSIVPNINALAAAIRDRRGHVVWVRNTTSGTENNWSVMHRYLLSPEKSEIRLRTMAKDHHGFEFYSDMDIRDGDGILAKTKYSAFIQGSSGLTEYLKDRGIDAVLIAGTATNVCCESTARDAMMLNFKTVMVDDCLAAYSDKEHSASLSSFYAMFGDVQSYRQTIAFLDRGVEARAWSENCSD